MKCVGAILLSLAILTSAMAETPVGAGSKKVERPDPVAQSYAALPIAERIAIETDLIWSGDYNGIADGDFGERAIAAVKAFQARSGGKQTGVLNPQERGQLAAAAKARQEAVGWRIVDDQVTGARLGIPAKLVPQSAQGQNGMRFTSGRGEVQVETFRVKESGTTLQGVFDQQRRDPARTIDYNVLKPDFFVLSGLQGGVKKFYTRAEFKDGEARGVTVLYDLATEGTMGRVVVAMSSAFAAFPAGAVAGPAVHKKVEYATGILVDDAGHVVTDRRATAGCLVITVAGLGNTDLVAEEDSTGLALLRLYGGRNLHPVALAAAGSTAIDVTVAGVADPQAQAGGGAVTTAKGRLGAATDNAMRPLEPAPAVGFSGAAVLDGAGRLAGMVELTTPLVAGTTGAGPQALVVPSDAIRKFLDREHVAFVDAGPRSAADLTAGIVRVICTRK